MAGHMRCAPVTGDERVGHHATLHGAATACRRLSVRGRERLPRLGRGVSSA
jgi:hypothetical protein